MKIKFSVQTFHKCLIVVVLLFKNNKIVSFFFSHFPQPKVMIRLGIANLMLPLNFIVQFKWKYIDLENGTYSVLLPINKSKEPTLLILCFLLKQSVIAGHHCLLMFLNCLVLINRCVCRSG